MRGRIDLLSTASRDGSIRIWDRRTPGDGDDWVGSVNLIKNAHGAKGKASKGVSDEYLSWSRAAADH